MQEIFEKIREWLEERQEKLDTDMWARQCDNWYGERQNGVSDGIDIAIEIVNQVADIYGSEKLHDRNKIYDYIKTQINPYGKPFQGSVKEFGYKVMDYIKNMPDVPDINVGSNDGWIPCCERLPETDGKYIVCTTKGSVYCTKYYGRGKFFGTDMNTHIEAWQPLPAPYKPKREVMDESWKNHKCGECALFGTDACYLITYVDEDSEACDEYIGYRKKWRDNSKEQYD